MVEKRWGCVGVHFENTFTDLTSDFAQNVCYVNYDLTMACRQADTSAACSINQATTAPKKYVYRRRRILHFSHNFCPWPKMVFDLMKSFV